MPLRATLIAAAAAVLGACVQSPERAETSPPSEPPRAAAPDGPRSRGIAKHQRLAVRARESGDLAAAESEWHIVVLLDPDNEASRRELEQTRAAIARTLGAELDSGRAAMRRGDADAAMQSMQRALALDPGNAEAAKALRELDRQRAARQQDTRAARAARNAAPMPADSFDVEQRIEIFRAGDVASGLRELARYVEAHPNDSAARAQIANAVYERAREVEAEGARESAATLYEQAIALRGEKMPAWSANLATLRKSLSAEYYDKGVRIVASDRAQAIRLWETSLKFDPSNKAAATKLDEARRTIAPTRNGTPRS